MKDMKISGWGRNKFILSKSFFFNKNNFYKNFGIIARGNGNSYGDNSLGKSVLLISKKNKILYFDKKNGIVIVESGITIDNLLTETIKNGWILNVIPGKGNVTIGGAIANDVHGKNHYKAGAFSKYVQEFTLLTQNFGILKCSKKKKTELFKATCGGLGLTGIIKSATIKLKKINSNFLETNTFQCNSINKIILIFKKYEKSDYIVSWYDFFSNKDKFIISIANHTNKYITNYKNKNPLNISFLSLFLNKFVIKISNFLYYLFNKNNFKLTYYKKFFFPLDNFKDWNKLYGSKGFYQYQFVIPEENSKNNLKKIISIIKKSKFIPYLAVMKKMGTQNSNYLSFPIKGYSFALDFKNELNITKFFDKLDKIIIKMKGRIYLAKDSSINKDNFFKMYPKVEEFKKIISKYNPAGKITSLQSLRLGLN